MPPGSSPAGPGAAARGSTLGRNSCRGATGARGGSRAAAAREAAAREPEGRAAMAARAAGVFDTWEPSGAQPRAHTMTLLGCRSGR